MKKTLPNHLIERFTELTNDIEAAIRSDERQRILANMRSEMAPPITGKFGEPVAVGMQTGMHGEPLDYNRLVSKARTAGLCESHRRMLGYLEKGFIAVPTLAGNLNIRKESVHNLCHNNGAGVIARLNNHRKREKISWNSTFTRRSLKAKTSIMSLTLKS